MVENNKERINKELVARTLGQVGNSMYRDGPEMRFCNIAPSPRGVNVKRGLIIDAEDTDKLYYAWTNEQRETWKVEESGSNVVVDEVSELHVADEDQPVDDEEEYVGLWIETIISELQRDIENGDTQPSIHDIVELQGSQILRLEGPRRKRKATAKISIE